MKAEMVNPNEHGDCLIGYLVPEEGPRDKPVIDQELQELLDQTHAEILAMVAKGRPGRRIGRKMEAFLDRVYSRIILQKAGDE